LDVPRSLGRRVLAACGVFLPPALVTLAAGGWQLTHRQVWQDESATWWAATLPWNDLLRLVGHTDVLLLPYYALMHLWVAAAGTSAGALRLPSLAAMAVAAGALALLGRRLLDARAGVVAGLLFALLPATSRYAQEAGPYAFAVLAAVLSTLVLLRALEDPENDRWWPYALALPFTGLFQAMGLLVLTAHLALVLARDRGRIGAWLSVSLVGVAPALPLVVLGQAEPLSDAATGGSSWTVARYLPGLLASTDGAVAVMAVAFLGLLFTRRQAGALLCWALVPPLLISGANAVVPGSPLPMVPGFLLFTLPAWALLAASGLCAATDAAGRATRWAVRRPAPETGRRPPLWPALAVGTAGALALGWYTLPDARAARANPAAGQPDFAAAARWVESAQQPGDALAFGGTAGAPDRTFAYMLRKDSGRPRDAFLRVTPQQDGTYTGEPCVDAAVCAAKVRRVWLVTTQTTASFYAGLPSNEATVFKKTYQVAGERRFTGSLRVVLLQRRH